MKKWLIWGGLGGGILFLLLFSLKPDDLGAFEATIKRVKEPTPSLETSLQNVIASTKKNIEIYKNISSFNISRPIVRPPVMCQYELPGDSFYKAEFVDVIKEENLKPGQHSEVKLYIKNVGNVRWYGEESGCKDKNFLHLGTAAPLDRASEFFTWRLSEKTGWLANNRIKMIQKYVDPGETATFSFEIQAPNKEAAYIEYFSPVVENVAWLADLKVYLKFYVGDISDDERNSLKFTEVTINSSHVKTEDRWIEINLSEQQMYIGANGIKLRSFPISTGKRATPTPTGSYSILWKQEVRVSAIGTPYIMPKWQGFTWLGHGMHALPSLAYDNGYYWTEARNHIGIPVSHGCVRLLPEDAEMLYEFTAVGTPLNIYY